MSKEILMVADAVSNEKGVAREVIFEAIESALATATKKLFDDEEVNCRVVVNRKSGQYETFRRWDVVADENFDDPSHQMTLDQAQAKNPDIKIGEFWEEKIENTEFGRIAAQTAKQVIVQKV
ncbi:MAG: NusA N-terminal domain-containing protein, partial [Pseudohongiella sp.]|nr:NusA N-terminal domain-containing protein [Pseudohongiella sp.]